MEIEKCMPTGSKDNNHFKEEGLGRHDKEIRSYFSCYIRIRLYLLGRFDLFTITRPLIFLSHLCQFKY